MWYGNVWTTRSSAKWYDAASLRLTFPQKIKKKLFQIYPHITYTSSLFTIPLGLLSLYHTPHKSLQTLLSSHVFLISFSFIFFFFSRHFSSNLKSRLWLRYQVNLPPSLWSTPYLSLLLVFSPSSWISYLPQAHACCFNCRKWQRKNQVKNGKSGDSFQRISQDYLTEYRPG
jgi:hypothetical protein